MGKTIRIVGEGWDRKHSVVGRRCPQCGGRAATLEGKCRECLFQERVALAEAWEWEAFAELEVRPNSPARPYRLALACESKLAQAWRGPNTLGWRFRKAAIQHFLRCQSCQKVDAVYWSLDMRDRRHEGWCHLLDTVGVIDPKETYRVTRYIGGLPSFRQWCEDLVIDMGSDHAFVGYVAEISKLPRSVTYELGAHLWEDPDSASDVELVSV